MAYIQTVRNKNGDSVYPVTKSDAVYFKEDDSQQTLTDKLKSMEDAFQDGIDTITNRMSDLAFPPSESTPDGIAEGITKIYNERFSAGQNDVTVSQTVSGRTVTATASNGKTSSASVALGTGSGSHTFTLTPTGNNKATKSMSAGYYNAGTVTADGTKSYSAGQASVTGDMAQFSTTFSGDKADGKRARFETTIYGTASIVDGLLTVTISGTTTAKANHWEGDDDEWGTTVSVTNSGSKTSTLQIY